MSRRSSDKKCLPPTPRTDAALDKEVGDPDSLAVTHLARQLERELAEVHAELDKAEISRKYSRDGAATWIEYSAAQRVGILAGGYRLAEEELAERADQSHGAAPAPMGGQHSIVGTVPAEESDEEFARQVAQMDAPPNIDRIISAVIRDVAELPERSSPDDWPEAMLVTVKELDRIIRRHFAELPVMGGMIHGSMSASRSSTVAPAIEALSALVEVENAIWNATGSALLAGEKCSKDDAGIIYRSLCEAGNKVAWAHDQLSSAPSAIAPLTAWLRDNAPDCGDNSCLYGGRGKGGMRTNGGCRCFKDLPTAKRIYVERLFSAVNPTDGGSADP